MTRRALIIGIDRYDRLSEESQLKGCVNDARLMWSVLSEHYGFRDEPGQLWFLSAAPEPAARERRPDRAGILRAFDELIDATQAGDMVVIYYAGHGSQVADRDLDEGDGRDSTIVPCDAERWSHPEEFPDASVKDITDDEIHVKLLRLSERTDNVTLIFDSCHSGTISRGGSRSRGLPADPRKADQVERVEFTPEDRALLGQREHNAAGWLATDQKYVLIAGCRDSEQSQEMDVGQSTHGALTYHLSEALVRARPGATYTEIFEDVATKVSAAARSRGKIQHPQIDGAGDRLLFNTEEIEPLAFVRVEGEPFVDTIAGVPGRRVNLAGGAAFGLTPGSLWAVVPTGARNTDERLGELEIERVVSTRSLAKVLTEVRPGAITEGAWAVPLARDFGDRRMPVRLVPHAEAGPDWEEFVRAVHESPALDVVDDPARDAVMVALCPPGPVRGHAELPDIGILESASLVVVSETGQPMAPPRPVDQWRHVLSKNLERWAQYRHRLGIENPLSALSRDVVVEVLRRGDHGDLEPVRAAAGEALPRIPVGERLHIRLKNRGSEAVHVNMLTFGIDGSITFNGHFDLMPSTPERPFKSLTGAEGADPMAWTQEFPFVPNPWVEPPTEAVEVWKFFVTRTPVDFRFLQQRTASRSRTQPMNPLEELLATAGATRSNRVVPDDAWGTVEFRFTLAAPAKAEVGEGQTVELPTVLVQSPDEPTHVTTGGTVRFEGLERRPEWPEDSPAGRLQRLIREQGLRRMESFTLGDGARRGARAAPARTHLTTRGAGEPGWGELMMSTDDAGLVRWHLPQRADGAPRTRGAASAGGATFRIERPLADPEDAPRTRGPLGATLGKVFVDHLAFPLLSPAVDLALNLWEKNLRPYRVRWFHESDLRSEEVREVDEDGWRRLGQGRTLLWLHGPLSRAHRAFRHLPEGFLTQLEGTYGDRIIALDHTTLSEDPLANAAWFLESLPPDLHLDLDIVAHSRGGLVARCLAERSEELVSAGRSVQVGRVVMVGAPMTGTPLADAQHVDTLLSLYTNVLSWLDPTEVTGPVVQLVQKLAAGAVKDLNGLQAMAPGSAFLQAFPGGSETTEYYGLSSDVGSGSDRFLRKLLDRMASQVLGGDANDLFVTQASALGGDGGVALKEDHVLRHAASTSHLGYFKATAVHERIGSWLVRESAPLRVVSTDVAVEAPIAEPTPESDATGPVEAVEGADTEVIEEHAPEPPQSEVEVFVAQTPEPAEESIPASAAAVVPVVHGHTVQATEVTSVTQEATGAPEATTGVASTPGTRTSRPPLPPHRGADFVARRLRRPPRPPQ